MRKLKFDLQVDPTALLAANPEAFYSKAYLSEDTADNYRALPGIKYKTKLATVTFGNILQPSSCSFSAPNDDLDAKEIDVCALSAMAQICQFDLEQSFLALQMSKGSNGDFSVASFMSFYWGEMANKINGDIELIRWQGDTTSLNPTLALCDGYEKLLAADPAVISGGSGSIANFTALEAALSTAFAALPATIATRTADLRLYMPTQLVIPQMKCTCHSGSRTCLLMIQKWKPLWWIKRLTSIATIFPFCQFFYLTTENLILPTPTCFFLIL